LSEIKRLTDLIEEHLGLDGGSVKLTDHFMNDLGCDSLDMFELLMDAEDEFKMDIDDSEYIQSELTVGKMAEIFNIAT